MHYLPSLLCTHAGDSHGRVALLLRDMGERKGVFSLFLREEATQPDRGPQSTFMPDMPKAPKLKDCW